LKKSITTKNYSDSGNFRLKNSKNKRIPQKIEKQQNYFPKIWLRDKKKRASVLDTFP